MKVKNTENLSFIATWLIFAMWLFMTFSLLWGFSLDLQYKILFGVLGGFTFECAHLWSLIKLKTYWDDKVKRAPYFVLYIIMAFFTVLAAVSFSGKTITAMTSTLSTSKLAVSTMYDEIQRNKNIMKGYDDLQIKYAGDTNRVGQFNYTKAQNDTLQKTNKILIQTYLTMCSNADIKVKSESDDAFSFYADLLRWSKSLVIIILLIVFFGGIEYTFFLMAPQEERKLVVSEKKEELLKYVDALMELEDERVKLKQDKDIAEATNIPLKQCKIYRDILSGRAGDDSILWKGKPIIEITRGATKANFNKNETRIIVTNKANLN